MKTVEGYNTVSESKAITLKSLLLRVIPYLHNGKTADTVKPMTQTKVKTKTASRSSKQIRMENFFRSALVWIAVAILLLVVGIMLTLIIESMPSIRALGIK